MFRSVAQLLALTVACYQILTAASIDNFQSLGENIVNTSVYHESAFLDVPDGAFASSPSVSYRLGLNRGAHYTFGEPANCGLLGGIFVYGLNDAGRYVCDTVLALNAFGQTTAMSTDTGQDEEFVLTSRVAFAPEPDTIALGGSGLLLILLSLVGRRRRHPAATPRSRRN
jgi:hypothetical protein